LELQDDNDFQISALQCSSRYSLQEMVMCLIFWCIGMSICQMSPSLIYWILITC